MDETATPGTHLVAADSTAPVVAEEPSLFLSEPPHKDHCPATRYLKHFARLASRHSMERNLRHATRTLSGGQVKDPQRVNWAAVTNVHVVRLQMLLIEEDASPATINAILAAVRGVMKEAHRLGLIDFDHYSRAVDVKPLRVDRKERVLSTEEVQALLAQCREDTSPAGVRDAAIFALAIGTGLRREELCGVQRADYTPEGTLVVRGEGDRMRGVPVNNEARDALAAWLEVWDLAWVAWLESRDKEAGSPEAEPLFVAVRRDGELDFDGASGRSANEPRARPDGVLSGQAIERMFGRRAEQAGVGSVSPQDCRRTFLSRLLEKGVDRRIVAERAGTSIRATRRYDR